MDDYYDDNGKIILLDVLDLAKKNMLEDKY